MSNQPNSTRAQKLFLQAFRDNPAGPPPSQWPAPSTLQRWLRNENFRNTLNQYRDTMHFQADFHIAAAATTAAKSIHSTITPTTDTPNSTPTDAPDLTKQLKSLTDLLRLSHIRQRFTNHPEPTATDEGDNNSKAKCHHVPRPGITWHDAPHVIANIFCDDDKGRLKAYMLLLTMRGVKGYEPFLAAFPEELARAKENAEKHYPSTQPPNASTQS